MKSLLLLLLLLLLCAPFQCFFISHWLVWHTRHCFNTCTHNARCRKLIYCCWLVTSRSNMQCTSGKELLTHRLAAIGGCMLDTHAHRPTMECHGCAWKASLHSSSGSCNLGRVLAGHHHQVVTSWHQQAAHAALCCCPSKQNVPAYKPCAALTTAVPALHGRRQYSVRCEVEQLKLN
jgi:hypothetical protein